MNRHALIAALLPLVLTGACGSDDKGAADAAPTPDAAIDAAVAIDAPIDAPAAANLDCLGDPSPTVAIDPVTVTANASAISQAGAVPVEGVLVEAIDAADPGGIALGSATTDAQGNASFDVPTGTNPLNAFMRATPIDTYLTMEIFAPDVIVADIQAPAIMLEPGTVNLLAAAASQSQDLENNGVGLVLVLDCAGQPIRNAVVTAPTGTIVYAGGNLIPDTSLTATSEAGTAFVFNIEPGEDLVFDAEVDSMSLRDNTARAAAGQLVSIAIQP